MSVKVYIGVISFKNFDHNVEIFNTKTYTKSLANLKLLLREMLQICVSNEKICYQMYLDDMELDHSEFSKDDFVEKLYSEITNISEESQCIDKFAEICKTRGDSYYNENWTFHLIESVLI